MKIKKGRVLIIFISVMTFLSCAHSEENNNAELNKYNFKLLKGSNHEVCNAYLAELNQYEDRDRPQCPRFIKFKSDLFEKLEWVPLTEDEIYKSLTRLRVSIKEATKMN